MSKLQPDGTLVKALGQAWRWQRMLDAGVYSSITQSSKPSQAKSCVSRIPRFALPAPDIVEAILAGGVDQAGILQRLERPLPMDWAEHWSLIGSTPPAPT